MTPSACHHDDARGMRIKFGLGIACVSKTDRTRQRRDRILVAGQEMPARLAPRPVVTLEIRGPLRSGKCRRFLGVDAERDDVEILAGLKRERLQPPREPGENLAAKQWASIIDRHQ